MTNQVTAGTSVANLVAAMYGTDFVNAKRVINTKVKNQKPNPENLTLAERILLNRRKEQQQQRKDSPSGSVDISELTNPNDERKTPTPEPTLAETSRRSPLTKQDSRRTLASEPQPGPSNTRKSETPPLPPIKNASPKPESRVESVKAESRRSNLVDSRKQTPVLPPIAGRESRVSRTSERVKDDGADEIQPPRDRREFDPNLGVGRDSEEPVSPKPVTPKPQLARPESEVKVVETQKEEVQTSKAPTPKPQKAETPKPEKVPTPAPVKPKTPEQPVVVPVVATAAATQDRRSKSRSRSRSRSRKRSRSRSKSPRRRSRSRRKSRRRSSSSGSRSSSRRRHRRSRSRKRHRSLSYSSSPRRRRRYSSSSEGRKRHSRGRSRSRRSSFDYDFERAKSLIRSLSRAGEFPRQRPFEQPYPYPMYAGNPAYPPYANPMYWPAPPRQESPRRKREIIIVQDGQVTTSKRRNNSSSESDVSVIVRDGKNKGKKGKVRKVSVSESESESERSKSVGKKKKGKRVNFVTKTSKAVVNEERVDSEQEANVERTTRSNRVQKKNTGKHNEVSESSENEHKLKENIPKMVAAPVKGKQPAVVEKQPNEVFTAAPRQTPRESTPLQTKSPNSKNTPVPKNDQPNKAKSKKGPSQEDLELQEAIEQLDKQADFELEQLKGSNSKRPPPSVNKEMQKKIFGKEFQANINAFLESK